MYAFHNCTVEIGLTDNYQHILIDILSKLNTYSSSGRLGTPLEKRDHIGSQLSCRALIGQ